MNIVKIAIEPPAPANNCCMKVMLNGNDTSPVYLETDAACPVNFRPRTVIIQAGNNDGDDIILLSHNNLGNDQFSITIPPNGRRGYCLPEFRKPIIQYQPYAAGSHVKLEFFDFYVPILDYAPDNGPLNLGAGALYFYAGNTSFTLGDSYRYLSGGVSNRTANSYTDVLFLGQIAGNIPFTCPAYSNIFFLIYSGTVAIPVGTVSLLSGVIPNDVTVYLNNAN